MLKLILAVGLAVVISSFCSVAEAVLYSFPWSLVEKLKRAGRKSGERLERLRDNIEEPITAILTFNTVAHTAGAAVAGAAWAAVFGEENLGWFAVGFTLIILILSEILPKTIGVVYAKQLAAPLAPPLAALVWLFKPTVFVVGWLGRVIKSGKEGPERDEDDIRALVTLTRRAGVIKPYEERSIRNILALDVKTVEEIMTPRTVVFSLPSEMTVGQAREGNSEWPHSRFPVYEGNDPEDVVGIVYRRQVFESLADGRHDVTLSEIMRPVRFVPESMTLDKLLARFLGSRMHMFVVLDEYGGMAGVVSLEDLLEEILGSEIVDETDQVVDMRELARGRRRELMEELAGDKARQEG
jgi:CBS domain containing-hemolysin-like protein